MRQYLCLTHILLDNPTVLQPISNLAHGFDDSDEGEGDEDAIDEEDDFEPQDEHGDLVRRTSDVHMD